MNVLPKSGDIELTLLKSHLVIEEVLTEFISEGAKYPKYIKDAKLSFAQKMHLARAMAGLSHAAWVWNALKLLNQARNELSHNLTNVETERKLGKFIEHVHAHNQDFPKDAVSEQFTDFHWAVFTTYATLTVNVHIDPLSKNKQK